MRLKTAAWLGLVLGLVTLGPALAGGVDAPVETRVAPGFDPDLAADLTALVAAGIDELHIPGVGVGVVEGYTLVYEAYVGWHTIEAQRPVAPDSIFRIGSISKSITAIGVLQQWEQGRLRLEDDVNDHLERPLFFPPHPVEKPATIRHLLTHTSGAGEFLSVRQLFMPGFGVLVTGDDYKPLEDYLTLGFHTKIDPGDKWAYCNYGFALLGLVIENASGQSFNDYMRANVFQPLGMTEATYQHTPAMLDRIITGYIDQGQQKPFKPTKHQGTGITPPGAVYATIPEFGLYVAALLNGGANRNGRVIKPETLALMMARQHSWDPRQSSYGFGLRDFGDYVWGGVKVIGHSGSVPFGWTSDLLMAPERRVGVYVFANSGTGRPNEIAWRALKRVLGATDQALPELEPDRSVWPELEGLYGPEQRDFKSNTRIYMSGVGRYQIKVLGDDLVLIYSWQGKQSAKVLHPVTAADPYFFWYEPSTPRAEGPLFLSFLRDHDKLYLCPGGVERFVKLGPFREFKNALFLPAGRLVAKVNPF